jgi:hypothetical protein
MTKVKANYLRRQAKRLDITLEKSKGKKWSHENQKGWRILQDNRIVLGEKFELNLQDVENYLDNLEKELRSK